MQQGAIMQKALLLLARIKDKSESRARGWHLCTCSGEGRGQGGGSVAVAQGLIVIAAVRYCRPQWTMMNESPCNRSSCLTLSLQRNKKVFLCTVATSAAAACSTSPQRWGREGGREGGVVEDGGLIPIRQLIRAGNSNLLKVLFNWLILSSPGSGF